MVLFMAINLWSAYCTSFNELLTARIIGGLAAGIVEALGPMIVTEIFDEKHLASAMVIYSFALGAGASIGPVIAGLVYNRTHNWPWVFNIAAIITGVNLLSSILMFPETTKVKARAERALSSDVDAEKSAHFEVEEQTPQEIPNWRAIWAERSFFLTLPDIKPEANFFVLFFQPFSLLVSPAVTLTAVTFGVSLSTRQS